MIQVFPLCARCANITKKEGALPKAFQTECEMKYHRWMKGRQGRTKGNHESGCAIV